MKITNEKFDKAFDEMFGQKQEKRPPLLATEVAQLTLRIVERLKNQEKQTVEGVVIGDFIKQKLGWSGPDCDLYPKVAATLRSTGFREVPDTRRATFYIPAEMPVVKNGECIKDAVYREKPKIKKAPAPDEIWESEIRVIEDEEPSEEPATPAAKTEEQETAEFFAEIDAAAEEGERERAEWAKKAAEND